MLQTLPRLFPQVATDAMENIRTVASLSKEAHFVSEYNQLTDIPYKCVDHVFFTCVNYIFKMNDSGNYLFIFAIITVYR